ncbi:MAG: histidine ammonia-lyase [Gemmatimonadota bacterium]|nr:MAG: histidine ammonia-lyase [Gemmatimonadota bacterium]
MSRDVVILDGTSLTIPDLIAVARSHARVEVAEEAVRRVDRARTTVERNLASGASLYGVNTGFGKLANVSVPSRQLLQLQRNLILSHVAGVGDPLPTDVVRGLMLLRANVLLRQTSGVRSVLAVRLAEMLNAGIHPIVPEQGSVGASGDLAPLAHVAYALMGEGEVTVASPRERTRVAEQGPVQTASAMRDAGLEPVVFEAKEGLSFINGTQAQSSILALLVHDSSNLWRTAHAAAAMSLEALRGTPVPFDERIHDARPHPGQMQSARLMRQLLHGSQIRESHREDDPRVQDAYSLRCTPQILGPAKDIIDYAATVAEIELNASTDNPLVIGTELLSGGNFHGQPIAMALDMLAIALATIAGVSERRIDRMLNPDTSQGLPPFLATNPGLESGLMMVQITAAALVAESRTLCTPASVQSIPTDGNQEDYVPMGMTAALKCRRILANTQRIVAAEFLTAAQGLEFHKPMRPGQGVERAYHRIRGMVPALTEDRPLTGDLEKLAQLIREEVLV